MRVSGIWDGQEPSHEHTVELTIEELEEAARRLADDHLSEKIEAFTKMWRRRIADTESVTPVNSEAEATEKEGEDDVTR